MVVKTAAFALLYRHETSGLMLFVMKVDTSEYAAVCDTSLYEKNQIIN
jgi:hypothetical protein